MFLTLLFLILINNYSFSQENPIPSKPTLLTMDQRFLVNYWNELAIKPGISFGYDLEFLNKKGHGIGITLPQILWFYFPDNSFHMGIWINASYRYISPKNGFYTALGMGLGWNMSWLAVPVFNLEGDQISPPAFHQMIATAQWDIGYDFSIKFPKHPFRMFFTMGWKGLYPNNLNINSNIFLQIGFNIKLPQTKG